MLLGQSEELFEKLPKLLVMVEVVGEQSKRLLRFRCSADPRPQLAQNAAQRLFNPGEAARPPVHRVDMRIGDGETMRPAHRRARPEGGSAAKSRFREPLEHG